MLDWFTLSKQSFTQNQEGNGILSYKLHDLSPRANYTEERPSLVREVSANFSDGRCRVVSATNPHGRILGFLDRMVFWIAFRNVQSNVWLGTIRNVWGCAEPNWVSFEIPFAYTRPVNISCRQNKADSDVPAITEPACKFRAIRLQ
jgi:hypothetical protein